MIRRSKTDQAGEGQEIAIPRGTHLRPVETLQTWLAAAAISDGPLFRPVSKGGRVGATPLGDDGFVRALKRRAAAAGLDPAGFSRALAARRVPHRRRRGRGGCAEDGGGVASPLHGHGPPLCAPR